MKLKVTEDKKFLQITEGSKNEIDQMQASFTKKVENFHFIKKRFNNGWDGTVKFIDKYDRIPIGLWMEVKNLAKKYNFQLSIVDNDIIPDPNYNEKEIDVWISEFFKDSKIKPRYYQIEALKKAIQYKYCTEEISTSAGKTLIIYMFFKYLWEVKGLRKFLVVVPNVDLVEQTEDKFYSYDEMAGFIENDWKSVGIYSGSKSRKHENEANIIFGTYQSLSKKDLNYFSKFDAVIEDECHHAKNASSKKILVQSYNAQYKFGVTGSMPKAGTTDSFTIQAYIGPVVYKLTSDKLINEGNATPVKILILELDYLEEEKKEKLYKLRMVPAEQKDGSQLLNLEKQLAREDRKRLLYICNTIAKVNKNSLILFGDIKNEYGKTIYNWLRENTKKNVYYIDGGTKSEIRELYKRKMEEEEDVSLVASVGTFSEGIDILNLHNIFTVESSKSQIIVRQILGRGMRLMPGKDEITVFDFADDYRYGNHKYQRNNYLIRHSNERALIYKEKKFPYKKFMIKL